MNKDLHNIKLGVISKGYGDITRNNLVINIGILGKAVATTNISYSRMLYLTIF